jgi:leader peptidase (prepilin peptidase)/N-methyltransferase
MLMVTAPIVYAIVGFVFGACIGSFLNVCIYRLPAGKSISWPPSHCPLCSGNIRVYDNLPILSFIVLRGRCRDCGARISVRYPLVELITGLAGSAVMLKFGATPSAALMFVFIAALIVITFIDIDTQRIFDIITLPGILLGIAASFFLPHISFRDALIGMLAGGGILYAIAWAYLTLKKREGMGGGDIKLLAMIGAFIGWQGVVMTIFIGSFAGTIVGGLQMILGRRFDGRLRIPFGPFLAIGAVTYVFYGDALFYWYLNLFR